MFYPSNRFFIVLFLSFGPLVLPAWGQEANKPDAQSSGPKPPTETTEQRVHRMNWRKVENLKLDQSNSLLHDMPGFQAVTGADAVDLRAIVDGSRNPTIEADTYGADGKSEVLFSWIPSGYVASTDFSEIDPDKLLEQIKENTQNGNPERAAKGLPPMSVIGWRQKPSWNEQLHTAYWVIEGRAGTDKPIVNAVALKLGRSGYERINWIVAPEQMDKRNDLTIAQDAHAFDSGSRYQDFLPGKDKTAAYGIAGLVAGVMGVKAIKAVGIGAMLLGFKKFFLLLLIPFIAAWNWIKGLFGRKKED